jgi:hypothetical protein
MSRWSRWRALVLGVGLAAAGAGMAYVLAGGPWAAAGAVVGAVAGSFAPSVYDGVRERGARRKAWQGTLENPPPQSWSRLLDPRRELVGFVGRKEELAVLVVWCEDDHAARLRTITSLGGSREDPVGSGTERMKKLTGRASGLAMARRGRRLPPCGR